jgi:crotonyl-CoA reductase
VFDLEHTGDAAYEVHHNLGEGKFGVLCLAPDEGLGATDLERREQHLDQITLFRRHHKQA